MDAPHISCIIMAAGASARFGSDKLAVQLGGRSLLRRACEAVPCERFGRVCLVTARPEGIALAREFGFRHVPNGRPEMGASLTVRLGLEAAGPCDAAMFMTSDQPLLRRGSVEALLEAWLHEPERIAALSHGGVRGNPVVFPRVIRRHPEELLLVDVPAPELADVDRPADLEFLNTYRE